jgi:uncharacterized repeat protein (TIGR02059 family)
MKKLLIIPILFYSIICSSQTVLTLTGQTFTSTYTVTHSSPTTFAFTNNSLTSSNTSGYQLNAGDEVPGSYNDYLDGSVITGNRITYTGAPSGTHGIFVGYNKNDVIKYNYSDASPYGIVLKAGNNGTTLTDASGVVAYNIFKNNFIGVLAKGFSGAKIYNNTFYNSMSVANSSATIFIQENDGSGGGNAPSNGTRIYNNIFYQTQSIPMIYIRDASCITGFASDYNVFYCANGNPWFVYGGVIKTFAQWQALGYDTHSVVVNPNFINLTDFVPSARLDYGTDLGSALQSGVSTNAVWAVNSAPAIAAQNGLWQVGARVYNTGITTISYVNSAIGNVSSSILEMTFSASLANIIPPATAFQVIVNSTSRIVNSVSVSGTKVLLTLASPVKYGDIITVGYTKPSTNAIQSAAGVQTANIISQTVTNNVNSIASPVYVSSVVQNATPNILEITYSLSLSNTATLNSAFKVLVNSAVRTINSVTISGTKVSLTLASKVVYGDVVTLAYTKPATNPIQTVAGGQAISLSAQKVTNNTINLVKQAPLTIKMTVYPNPVHHTVNIQWVYLASLSGQDATMLVSKIRILDLSGKLYVEKLIQAGATSLRIAIDLRPGIYVVVALSSGGTQMFSQKIIVY